MPESKTRSELPEEMRYVAFDYAIKYILRDKACFGILEGLLTCVLGRTVIIRELLESESNPEDREDKLNRVDLLCALEPRKKTGAGRKRTKKPSHKPQPELVLIEIQTGDLLNFFHRMIFGSSKLVTQFLNKGNDYEKVRKVISITIANFGLGEGSDYAYHGKTEFRGMHTKDVLKLSLDQRKVFGQSEPSDIFPEYYIFRLKNFEPEEIVDQMDQWLYFLKEGDLPEIYDAPGLEAAKERLNVFHMAEAERMAYERYLEGTRDRRSLVKTYDYKLDLALENLQLALEARQDAEAARQDAEAAKQAALEAREVERQRADEAESRLAELDRQLKALQKNSGA